MFARSRTAAAAILDAPAVTMVRRFWFAGWGFDWLYDRLFVRPLVWLAHADRNDVIDRIFDGLAWSTRAGWRALARTETGLLRWYAAGITIGALAMTALALYL